MSEISKLQMEILESLYSINLEENKDKRIQPEYFMLEEKDEIMQIRELVFNIDKLINLDLVQVIDKYYVESDNMSFEYMNNALEILDDRIKITNLGIEYIEELKKGSLEKINERIKYFIEKTFTNHPYKVIGSHLLSFLLGILTMWILSKYII